MLQSVWLNDSLGTPRNEKTSDYDDLAMDQVHNSRPITYVESDAAEPEPLSPAKFLIGRNPSDNGFQERKQEEQTEEEIRDNWFERK